MSAAENYPGPNPAPGKPAPVERWLAPLVRFLHTEASSGVLLMLCTVAALALANSPWAEAYHAFWHTHVTLTVGIPWLDLDKPLEWWVNDGLMTLFFFVVGLEIKRELVTGELREPRKAALPAAAALGGMIVPALIYLALQFGKPGERGWGIPMATDIAFVVGVMALLGPRVPAGLKVMLLSLAIVDDLGAVLVIAIAYTSDLSMLAMGMAGLGVALVVLLHLIGVRSFGPYVLVGVGVWLAVYRSGVHPTIAGVVLGLLTPAREWLGRQQLLTVAEKVARRLRRDRDQDDDLQGHGHQVHELVVTARETLAPLDRLETALHPWVAFVIMPTFALANAGVHVEPGLLRHPVALAVALGLLVGKPVGVVLFSWAAVWAGLARLPRGVTGKVLVGGGGLAGIGFTMSLFVTGLAFPPGTDLNSAAKVGTLMGSVVSAAVGCTILLFVLPRKGGKAEPVAVTPAEQSPA